MRSSSLVITLVASIALACEQGTSGADKPAAPPVSPPATPAPVPSTPARSAPAAEPKTVAQGSAQLKLTGAITKDLRGQIVTCGFTRLDGRAQGGTWAIRSDELDFQIIALTDEELDAPAATLNARQPARISYVFKRKAGKVTAAKDRTVAEIDADLHNVVGPETVHVKGTMTCPPRT